MISSSGVMVFCESDAEGGEEEEEGGEEEEEEEAEEDEKRRVAVRGRARVMIRKDWLRLKRSESRIGTMHNTWRLVTYSVRVCDIYVCCVRRCAAASGRREGHTLMSTAGLSSQTYLASTPVQSACASPC